MVNQLRRENLHVVFKIFMVNQMHRENLVRKTFMVSESHLMKSVQLDGAESHSGMDLETTVKATQTKLKGIHAPFPQLLNGFQT